MLGLPSMKVALGYSLVELLIAVVIIGILAALGIPSYKAWIANTQIRNAAESIQNGLQIARSEAIKRNGAVQFSLRGTHSAWTVCLRPAAPGSCPDPDDASTIQSRPAGAGSSANVTVTSTDAGPYVFNSFGAISNPVAAAADGLIRMSVDINTSVLSATDSVDLNLVIGLGGSVRICDPSVSSSTDPRKCPG